MEQAHDWSIESEPGLTVGEKITPITSAGLFTPSGKASYPSVAYQLAVPAVVAGVPSLSLVVPPIPGGSGEVDPAVLVVCRKLGIERGVPRQRSRRHRRAGIRNRDHPYASARSSGPDHRRSPSPRWRCNATASPR